MTNTSTRQPYEWITTAVAAVAPGWTVIHDDYSTSPLLAYLTQELQYVDGSVHGQRVVPSTSLTGGELDAAPDGIHVVRDDEADDVLARFVVKVAVALSVLEGGGGDVTEDVWERAELILRRSDAVRGKVQAALTAMDRKANEARATADAAREVVKSDALEQRKAGQTRRRVLAVLGKPENADGLPMAKLRSAAGSAYRDNLVETVDRLVELGELEEVPGAKAVRYRVAAR